MILTERLVLRRFEIEDAPDIQRLAGDPEVALKTGNIPHPYPDGAAAAWIERGHQLLGTGTLVPLAITLSEQDRLIGCISFIKKQVSDRDAELAYWLGKQWWGLGYMIEAARACLTPGALPIQLSSVWAGVLPENSQSIRVLEKLGMTPDGSHQVDRSARGGKQVLLRYRMHV